MLQRNRADPWEIGGNWERVVGQTAGQELPIRIVDEVFHEGAAEALYSRADHLAMQGQRVDDPANILDDNIVDEVYPTCLGIDGDVRGSRTIGIGEPLIIRKAGIGLEPVGCQFRQRDRVTVLGPGSAIDNLDLLEPTAMRR